MRLRPAPDYSLDYTLNYDVNFQQIRRMLASANVTRPGFMLQASWSRSYKISDDPTKRGIGGETLSGSTSFDILPRRLMVEGSANYDLVNKNLYQMHAQVRYSVQCCGFLVAFNRLNWTTTPDTQWRFSIELANVGSIGTSTGADLSGGRSGLGGYR